MRCRTVGITVYRQLFTLLSVTALRFISYPTDRISLQPLHTLSLFSIACVDRHTSSLLTERTVCLAFIPTLPFACCSYHNSFPASPVQR